MSCGLALVQCTMYMAHSNVWKPPSSLEVAVSATASILQVSRLVASRLQAGDKHCMARIAQSFILSYLALHTQCSNSLMLKCSHGDQK